MLKKNVTGTFKAIVIGESAALRSQAIDGASRRRAAPGSQSIQVAAEAATHVLRLAQSRRHLKPSVCLPSTQHVKYKALQVPTQQPNPSFKRTCLRQAP